MKSESPRIRERVRWSDVDKMGVMYFGAYIRFMEIAETEFFRDLGFTYDGITDAFGVWMARIHLEVDYRFPARLDDEIVSWAEVTKIGGSSIHFRFPIERSDGRRLADTTLVLACLHRESLKSTRVPAELAAAIRGRMPSASAVRPP